MADQRFQELLRRYHASNYREDGAKMFHEGQRLGFTLDDYRNHGVAWMTVVDNLWQLNSVFLTPEEDTEYRKYLRENTGSGPYADTKMLFARSTGDWHPTWQLDRVSVYAGSLASPTSPHGLQNWGDAMRIAFWGQDDTGMELDIGGESNTPADFIDETLYILEDIIRRLPPVISISSLVGLGFVRA